MWKKNDIKNKNNQSNISSLSLENEIITNNNNNHDVTFSIGLSSISKNLKDTENNSIKDQGFINDLDFKKNNNNVNNNSENNYTITIGGISNIILEEQNDEMRNNYKDVYLSIDEAKLHYEVIAIKIITSDATHMVMNFSSNQDYLQHLYALTSNSLYS